MASGNKCEKIVQVQDLLSARVTLHEIRGDLYRFICTPPGRETEQSGFHDKFLLLQSKTRSYIHTGQDHDEKDADENVGRLLTIYEELVLKALHDIETGKEHEIIASLYDGPLRQSHQKIDESLSAATGSAKAVLPTSETDTLQAQVNALFTIIEIIGAIAVLFPGVFVSIGVPATFARSITMLNQVQKVYPGVQLVLDRKNEIMILVGTMTSFAGGIHKNAARLLQQVATDENAKNITVVDETGKTIPVSELFQYALDLETGRNGLAKEGPVACQSGQSSGTEADQDIFRKLTRLMDTITNPVGESLKAADQLAHQGIQARLEDVSRGKELILQVPLILSNAGVRVGTDISDKIREFSEKVSFIKEKDSTENEQP